MALEFYFICVKYLEWLSLRARLCSEKITLEILALNNFRIYIVFGFGNYSLIFVFLQTQCRVPTGHSGTVCQMPHCLAFGMPRRRRRTRATEFGRAPLLQQITRASISIRSTEKTQCDVTFHPAQV